MIHETHRAVTVGEANLHDSPIANELSRQFFPNVESIQAGRILNKSGEGIGSILQTSPSSDHIIGYSGPTNCLILLDAESRIRSVAIASSGDTVEHFKAVEDDPDFLNSFRGIGFDEQDRWQEIDAVSGATLTSYAIVSSVANRMGGNAPSLKFSAKPGNTNLRSLFPKMSRSEPTDRLNVWDITWHGAKVGFVLSTSPFADQLSGYQGPTKTLAGFDADGKW